MLSLKDKLALTQKSRPVAREAEDRGRTLPGFTELGSGAHSCLIRETPMEQVIHPIPEDWVWPLVGQDEGLTGFTASSAVYLDLETTGLYLGAGAFAFLIGLGMIKEGRPWLVQLFLRDPRDEMTALEYVAACLGERPALVTYNGKCFDWPLLKDRFLMHRMLPPEVEYHLDLLHPARRLWKEEFPRCNLGEVENRVLGVTRQDDIEGYLIPAAYGRYLREGVIDEIGLIVQHNATDIASLFNLTLYCGQIYSHQDNCSRDSELMAVAQTCMRRGDYQRAIDYLTPLAVRQGRYQGQALYLLGMACKRRGDWPQALAWWERAAVKHPLATRPLEEMAKYYEHVEHDYVQAHALAYQALQIALKARRPGNETRELAHRVRRLQERLERQGA